MADPRSIEADIRALLAEADHGRRYHGPVLQDALLLIAHRLDEDRGIMRPETPEDRRLYATVSRGRALIEYRKTHPETPITDRMKEMQAASRTPPPVAALASSSMVEAELARVEAAINRTHDRPDDWISKAATVTLGAPAIEEWPNRSLWVHYVRGRGLWVSHGVAGFMFGFAVFVGVLWRLWK